MFTFLPSQQEWWDCGGYTVLPSQQEWWDCRGTLCYHPSRNGGTARATLYYHPSRNGGTAEVHCATIPAGMVGLRGLHCTTIPAGMVGLQRYTVLPSQQERWDCGGYTVLPSQQEWSSRRREANDGQHHEFLTTPAANILPCHCATVLPTVDSAHRTVSIMGRYSHVSDQWLGFSPPPPSPLYPLLLPRLPSSLPSPPPHC